MIWKTSTIIPDYEVSDTGVIRLLVDKTNKRAGYILKGIKKKSGHLALKCLVDGEFIRTYAHTVVLTAFKGPRPEGMQCAHYDGNPKNNHIDNLRWATYAENAADKIRHGNHLNGHRKFKADEVLEMRAMHERGETYADIKAMFKISGTNLSVIINRKTWRHI
tara:strand:+ start:252 stop:740 length:489 start_codon:yes stop_codon:yes gene_type:complete